MKKFTSNNSFLSKIPAVHKVLEYPDIKNLVLLYGQPIVVNAIREIQSEYRDLYKKEGEKSNYKFLNEKFIKLVKEKIDIDTENSLIPVFNLTGIILHSNLGRALLPEVVINSTKQVASIAHNIEYDLNTGKRSDRERHIENKLCNLLGTEAVTIVNNNAAAVILVLNTLAKQKEVLVSRGELIEIGGSFRLPEIMMSANCKLREVGTTNKTHLNDYKYAIKEKTGLIFKAYTSNFTIKGFTKNVKEKDLVNLGKDCNLPFVVDLGSGSLIDLRKFGLKFETSPSAKLKQGIDLVTFSGDKLMGGPQCGIIAGRSDLIKKIKKNPMKRAMRCDKFTVTALSTLLDLYQNPEKALKEIPTLRLLSRSKEEIQSLAEKVFPYINSKLKGIAKIKIVNCNSQVGSGSHPNEFIPSIGISIKKNVKKRRNLFSIKFAEALRKLPTPIIGRIKKEAVILDLRCLEQEDLLIKQLEFLDINMDF